MPDDSPSSFSTVPPGERVEPDGSSLHRQQISAASLDNLTAAANAGDTAVQRQLGLAYARGLGVPLQMALAFKWLSLAAEAGDPEATRQVQVIMNAMRPAELAQGRHLLALHHGEAVTREEDDRWSAEDAQPVKFAVQPEPEAIVSEVVEKREAVSWEAPVPDSPEPPGLTALETDVRWGIALLIALGVPVLGVLIFGLSLIFFPSQPKPGPVVTVSSFLTVPGSGKTPAETVAASPVPDRGMAEVLALPPFTNNAGVQLSLAAAPIWTGPWPSDIGDVRARVTLTSSPLLELESAAAAGDAEAQFELGLRSQHGRGLPVDAVRAGGWYARAAGQRHADAMNNLGVLYAQGSGMSQNFVLAYKWFSLAVRHGCRGAVRNRNQVAEMITAPQLEEAVREVSAFLALPDGAVAAGVVEKNSRTNFPAMSW